MLAPHQAAPYEPQDNRAIEQRELLERAQLLAQGVEFIQTLVRAANLEEAHLLLTNDIRCLIEFDRCFLISHMGGQSRFVAAGAALTPEKKSRFYRKLSELAPLLVEFDRPLLIASDHVELLSEHGITGELQEELKSFVAFSGSTYFLCLPLMCNGGVIGDLIFEFLADNTPDKNSLLVLQRLEPMMAASLAQKWLAQSTPAAAALLGHGARARKGPWEFVIRRIRYVVPALLLLVALLFVIPFAHTVGGEAEVVPSERHLVFSRLDGLIEKVLVREGSEVQKGAVLATLDPKDLEFRITVARRELDILTQEMGVLSDAAGQNPSKLAQAQLVELNRKKKTQELDYLKSRRAFLELKAPVAGTVTTKSVQSLAGKRLGAGDAFCEIAVRSELSVDVNVPDDRITFVKPGQDVLVYLNSNPSQGYKLKITEIAPRAEALPRFGNVFRARATFAHAPATTMVGMKGIGKINTGSASLWSMISRKLITRWNEFSAHLS
jgi:multidrug resistance efflux pump